MSISILFFGAILLIENINGRFFANDFKVYFEASNVFFSGGNPYGEAFGLSSGFFKYAPATLLLFLPYQITPFEIAKYFHFVICSAAFIHALFLIISLAKKYFNLNEKNQLKLGLILILISAVHLSREMHLLNVNLIMIWLTLMLIHAYLNQRIFVSSMLFAVLILIKPYFALLFFPFLIKKETRLIFYTAVNTILFSTITIFVVGFSFAKSLHLSWLDNMTSHHQGMISEHTFSSIIYSYSGITIAPKFQLLFIPILVIVYLFYRRKNFIYKVYSNALFILDLTVLVALIPNLVITDSEHFLYSIPLIGLLIQMMLINKAKITEWVIFSILIFFYGANSNDLLGNPISDAFDRFSTIGLANLMLVLMAAFYYRKMKRNLDVSY